MSDQNGNGAEAPQAAPRFTVLAQYTKDLSFENPNAPRTLGPQQTQPNLSVQINVNARQLAPTDFEVSLMLEGGAGQGAEMLFKFELNYAGVFRIENFPADQVQPVVMIEGPRLLFPFARQIIADESQEILDESSEDRLVLEQFARMAVDLNGFVGNVALGVDQVMEDAAGRGLMDDLDGADLEEPMALLRI